jgi:formylglycine-generating enzyme required for sulfatase activity
VGYLRKHLQDAPPPFRAAAPGLPVPPAVEGVVMKALTKDRNQRYASAPDFARELTSAAQVSPRVVATVNRPVIDRGLSPSTRTHGQESADRGYPLPVVTESPSRVKFAILGLVLLAAIAGGIWYFSRSAPGPPPNVTNRSSDPGKSPVPIPPGATMTNPKDGLKYVWIPPGTFMMGCSPGDSERFPDEKPAHQVTITKGFWLGQTKVTVGAYKRFAGVTGRQMPPEPDLFGRSLNPGWGNEAMPVVEVTWDDAQAYCGWAGGRLPTEAEWEYAARGGSTAARYGDLDGIAWYADNSGRQRLDSYRIFKEDLANYLKRLGENGNGMHEVGQKRVNGFGLYDMLGNVWEWVNDWYDEKYYQGSPSQDPAGPTGGTLRVLRGGSWDGFPRLVRVSNRLRSYPGFRGDAVGFRCGGEVAGP